MPLFIEKCIWPKFYYRSQIQYGHVQHESKNFSFLLLPAFFFFLSNNKNATLPLFIFRSITRKKKETTRFLKGKSHPEPSPYVGRKVFPPNSYNPLSASQECLGHYSQKQGLSVLSTVPKHKCIWKERSYSGKLSVSSQRGNSGGSLISSILLDIKAKMGSLTCPSEASTIPRFPKSWFSASALKNHTLL